MEFQFVQRAPAPPLSRYVDAIWYARGRIDYASEHIVPTGHVSLLIVLGDPIEQRPGDADALVAKRSIVSGVQNRSLLNRPIGETHVCGVSFTPGGAYPLLGVPLRELTDRVVELDRLWGCIADELRETIGEARTVTARLAALERGLRRRMQPDHDADRIELALRRLRTSAPPSVRALAAEIGISNKHLIHLCKKLVGAGPKRLARIYRLNRVLTDVRPNGNNWADLAAKHGFADQSHLSRDFRDLAGMTPAAYVSRRRAVFGDASSMPNFVPNATG